MNPLAKRLRKAATIKEVSLPVGRVLSDDAPGVFYAQWVRHGIAPILGHSLADRLQNLSFDRGALFADLGGCDAVWQAQLVADRKLIERRLRESFPFVRKLIFTGIPEHLKAKKT